MTEYRLERLAAEVFAAEGAPSVSAIWWLAARRAATAADDGAAFTPLLFGTSRAPLDVDPAVADSQRGHFVLRYERAEGEVACGAVTMRPEASASEVVATGPADVAGCEGESYLDRVTVASPSALPGLARLAWGRAELDRATVAYAALDFDDGRTWSAGATWPRGDDGAAGLDAAVAIDFARCEDLGADELALALRALRALGVGPAMRRPIARGDRSATRERPVFERVPFRAGRGAPS